MKTTRRKFFGTAGGGAALMLASFGLASCARVGARGVQARAVQGQYRPVPALNAGDKVAIVAPASPSGDAEKAAQWLRAHGFFAEIMPSAMEKLAPPFDYLAGTDSARVDDIHHAFLSSDIKAVWCLRGGFGATRLLDKLDYALIGANPKPFIGYSDITALHVALQKYAGLVTFHGPMLASDLVQEKLPPTASLILDLLSGRLPSGSLILPRRCTRSLRLWMELHRGGWWEATCRCCAVPSVRPTRWTQRMPSCFSKTPKSHCLGWIVCSRNYGWLASCSRSEGSC